MNEVAEKLKRGAPYVILKSAVSQDDSEALEDAPARRKVAPRRWFGTRSEAAFIRTARCFATLSASPISSTKEFRESNHRWTHICSGQNGYRFSERDRKGLELVPYRGQECAPRDGARVQLTVDLNLQNIVENEIDAAMREYTPAEGDRYPDATRYR